MRLNLGSFIKRYTMPRPRLMRKELFKHLSKTCYTSLQKRYREREIYRQVIKRGTLKLIFVVNCKS